MRLIISIAAALILTGCAALQEASKSIAVEIDWAGIFQAFSTVWKH